ncbi:MAG: DNA ligase D [Syntrophorhabdales bacterium]|jgi:bifunctional non-homologous end joining protein LigD
MKLKEYRKMRDFSKTPEPPGREGHEEREPLRFVVHKHRASHLHFDLRLELDGVLKSWAIPKGPSLDPGEKRLAMMVEDHPFEYRTFEGMIPEGNYGAGPVMIWDRGTYHAAGHSDRRSSEEALRQGLAKGHISFVLDGERLKGEFALVKLKKVGEESWLLIKKGDDFAHPGWVARADTSVVSGRTMEEIEEDAPDASRIDLSDAPKAPMPTHVRPMMATLVEKPFDRPGWLFEIKWDGYRALAEVREGRARLYSRNDKSLNAHFIPVVASLESLPFEGLLDGEVVVVDESGKADFQLLQNYLRSGRGSLVYYVFDLLYYNGHDLRVLPLTRRKSILRQVLPGAGLLKLSDHVEEEGAALFKVAKESGIEGIVAKDGASPYRSGHRGYEWLKVKTSLRQEAVIAGFTRPRGGRKGFGSLVLGVYEDGLLVYIGHTGTGFTEEQLAELHGRLQSLVVKKSPFEKLPPTNAPVTWVAPEVVCEVRFAEWTDGGVMRQPVFLGLREDMDPRDVGREQPEGVPRENPVTSGGPGTSRQSRKKRGRLVAINDSRVELTNLDKVFWPQEGYTKGDVIDYYRSVSPFIVPYLKDRPESLHRHPDGIAGESFFQKNMDQTAPDWVQTVRIRSESEDREIVYLLCQDEATLVYMANLGCIEINPWHSRIGRLDNPDYMVLDIDPLDTPFHEVVRTATTTRNVLLDIGARGFCKTSGASGLHVYVPLLGAAYSHDQAVQFARLVNILVHQRLPDSTSMERNPEKRRGKVYLDYLQNMRGQTLAAPYCVRSRRGATVSTPLEWDEVTGALDPTRFTMKTIMKRLQEVGDLWKGVLGPGIDMEQCLGRLEAMVKG